MRVPTQKRVGFFNRREKADLLYIHIPKCGGSTIDHIFTKWIRACPSRRYKETRGHLTFREYKSALERKAIDLSQMQIFTSVRNPWDWHVSWFHYLKADAGKYKSGMKIEVDLFQKFEFSDYLRWLADPEAPTSPTRYVRKNLLDYISDESGHVVANHILKQDSLIDDLQSMRNTLELEIDVPNIKVNTSPRTDYRNYYDDFGIELISKLHQRDIDYFRYSF